jgi:hypothetical protein
MKSNRCGRFERTGESLEHANEGYKHEDDTGHCEARKASRGPNAKEVARKKEMQDTRSRGE